MKSIDRSKVALFLPLCAGLLLLLAVGCAQPQPQWMESPRATADDAIQANNVRSVRVLEDRQLLEEVAAKAKYWRVRREALLKLDDQALYARYAHQGSSELSAFCIEHLQDQTALGEVAKRQSRDGRRLLAIERLTDQTILTELAERQDDRVIQYPAIARLKDEAVLQGIHQLSANPSASRLALLILALHDPSLGEVAGTFDVSCRYAPTIQGYNVTPGFGDPQWFLGGERLTIDVHRAGRALSHTTTATEFPVQVTIPQTQTDPADGGGNFLGRRYAEVNIEEILGRTFADANLPVDWAQVAAQGRYESLQTIGLLMHAEQDDLRRLACESPCEYVRSTAVLAIDDQATLDDVARHAAVGGTRVQAARRLTDEDRLLALVEESSDERVRLAAALALDRPDVYVRMALNDASQEIRTEATKRTTDQEVLAQIALSDESETMRLTAVANVQDQQCLRRIVGHDDYTDVRGFDFRRHNRDMERAGREALDLNERLQRGDSAALATLAEVAQNAQDDSEQAKRAAAMNRNDRVRAAAVRKLDDTILLSTLSHSDPSEQVREAARKRLEALPKPDDRK